MESILAKKLDVPDLEQKVKKMCRDGMDVLMVRNNEAYSFISKAAKGASRDYGVKSVSLVATKK